MSESSIGKKAEGRIVGIKDGGVNLGPMGHTLERCCDFSRFTAFVTSLQEDIAGMFRLTKRLVNERDQALRILHLSPPFLLERGFCYSLSREDEP